MQTEPRISINKLMEYRLALPSRRREIVDDQKNPLANRPKMAWYATARKTIIEFISNGCVDESILDDAIMHLMEKIDNLDETDPKKLESKTKRIFVDIDAIKSFKSLYPKLQTKGLLFSKVSKKPNYLDYSGVHVSVRPEIIVMKKTWEPIGCIKLYLTKGVRLKDEGADFLCAVLNHYADKYLSPHHAAIPSACMVIDVFGGKIFTASKNVPLHTGEIQKNCAEIKKIWPTIPTRKPIGGDDGDDGQMNFPE